MLKLIGRGPQSEGHLYPLRISIQADGDFVTRLIGEQQLCQLFHGFYLLIIQPYDHISHLYAGQICRRYLIHKAKKKPSLSTQDLIRIKLQEKIHIAAF